MVSRTFKSIFYFSIVTFFILSSCNRNPTIGGVLYKETKNKIYKDIEEGRLSVAIKEALSSKSKHLKNGDLIKSHYENNAYKADLLIKHFGKEKLNLLVEYLRNSNEHGLKPSNFKLEEFKNILSIVSAHDRIETLDDAYANVALLEITTADALLSYTSALQYGILNPNKILQRYYIETKQADSTFMSKVFNSNNIENLLDSVQPKSAHYKAMQKVLIEENVKSEREATEKAKVLMANLERSRWQQEIDTLDMIYVNIPAFQLEVYKKGKAVKEMKVVVGKGRNSDGKATFPKDDKIVKDNPHSHETPILASRIHSVQVNPVWNIPESIARNEILKHVQNDRFYLVNAGIDVLKDGKLVEDIDAIDWNSLSADNLPYRFRQRPGESNSLGKIKFLFKNNSSVYLHDTPAKAGFNQKVRAASHGCVRVERPMDLAKALFGEGDKFNTIQTDMESTSAQGAKDIALSLKTQVVLDYKTVVLKNNELQFYKDVYGQDIVLYSYL